ncbi:hypothetical protein [Streptomyces prunicolor]
MGGTLPAAMNGMNASTTGDQAQVLRARALLGRRTPDLLAETALPGIL